MTDNGEVEDHLSKRTDTCWHFYILNSKIFTTYVEIPILVFNINFYFATSCRDDKRLAIRSIRSSSSHSLISRSISQDAVVSPALHSLKKVQKSKKLTLPLPFGSRAANRAFRSESEIAFSLSPVPDMHSEDRNARSSSFPMYPSSLAPIFLKARIRSSSEDLIEPVGLNLISSAIRWTNNR